MIGAIIGAVAALGSGIANGVLGAKESARQASARRRMRNENRLWYDRRYNEEGRETAVGQRMRERMLEASRARQASARGKGAVMGGTTALQAAESAESNRAMGDLLGRLDANQESRRDRIEQQYRQREFQLDNMDLQASAQHQAQLANAVTTASAVASQIGGAVDSARSSSPKVDSSGASAASGGTTAAKTGTLESGEKYYTNTSWDNNPLGNGELGGNVYGQWLNPSTMQYEPIHRANRVNRSLF